MTFVGKDPKEGIGMHSQHCFTPVFGVVSSLERILCLSSTVSTRRQALRFQTTSLLEFFPVLMYPELHCGEMKGQTFERWEDYEREEDQFGC